MPRVVIVATDGGLINKLEDLLSAGGFEPVALSNGETAVAYLQHEEAALCLLDLDSARGRWQLLKRASEPDIEVPVVALGSSSEDRRRANELRVYECVETPFDDEQLLRTLRTMVRRNAKRLSNAERGSLETAELRIEPQEAQAYVANRSAELTAMEFLLLYTLAREPGRLFTRDELQRLVWRRRQRAGDRTVDVYVGKLRRKIDEQAVGHRYIHTVKDGGYVFEPRPRRADALRSEG
jgi:DNA-binding response OmpR family regulator